MVHDMRHEHFLECKTQTKAFFLIMLTDDCTNKNNSVMIFIKVSVTMKIIA